jgi:hypothetical protein
VDPKVGGRRLAALVCVAVLLAGCGTFTKPTGRITVDRQDFIDSYALAKVLYQRVRSAGETYCLERQPPQARVDCMVELSKLDSQAKLASLEIEAKIAVPESEVDWGTIVTLLRLIAAMVP